MKAKLLILLDFIIISFSFEQTEEDAPPVPVNLIFPANNTACNEGVVVDENRSTVTFQWESAANTNTYTLFLEDLDSKIIHQEQTSDTELPILLTRGITFKWYVKSQSDNTAEIARSEVWSFYNAGEGVTSHVPFPAELLSPSQGEAFANSVTTVKLEWAGNDLDDDILEYEVYFGESNPPNHLEQVLSEESMEVSVNAGKTYYWFVKTIDKNNNSSNSTVSHLKVN